MRTLATIATTVVAGLLAFAVGAQDTTNQKPANRGLTSSQAALQSWNEIGRKLIVMAEDFPADNYDFRVNLAPYGQ
jgi:hypothetical protein